MIKEFFLEYFALARKKQRATLIGSCILIFLILFFTAVAMGFELIKLDKVRLQDVMEFLSSGETIVLLILLSLSPLVLLISSAIFLATRKSYSQWALTELAVDNPQDVVWVYRTDTNIKVSGASVGKYHGFSIGNKWGRIYKIAKVEKEKLEQFFHECPAYFTSATVGWSDALEAQYKKDPVTLAIN